MMIECHIAHIRAYATSKNVINPHTRTIFFDKPLHIEAGQDYDIEHNLIPTDVTNHSSGAPITILGADLWTCYGKKYEKARSGFFSFKSVDDRRRGRCSLEEGQLPYFLYWPFL